MSGPDFFDRLEWKEDRMVLDGRIYRLQHFNGPWTGSDDHFVFYKTRDLVEQYRAFLAQHPGFAPQRIFELGLWDGGSMVFWAELFKPARHVGADIQVKQNSPCFEKYLAQDNIRGKLKPYWNVDQGNSARLLQIWQNDFNSAPLDLVIDDASHHCAPTRASFETLFPRLRPGGFYLIEDWAWGHWASFLAPGHPWAAERPLTELIVELLEAVGTGRGFIRGLHVCQGFVAVERGDAEFRGTFSLEGQILKRGKLPAKAPAPAPAPVPPIVRHEPFGILPEYA